MNLTDRVATFIVDTPRSAVPKEATDAAVRPIADTIGVIMAGSSGDAGKSVIAYADALGPVTGRTWTGSPAGLSPDTQALISSTLGHALDYDDELAGVGHPSSILVSAMLALPLAELSGDRMLEAFVIGYEVNVKVANALGHRHYRKGWHTTATVGGFGAAAAACRLLNLDLDQTRFALGIVASLAGGLQRNFGTMTKPLHSGLAARNGVLAAQLARSGFTASADILDGGRGFFDVYADQGDHPNAIDRLGAPWAILDPGPTLKKYPCCYATHRPIDAVLQLQARHGIEADSVEKITVRAPTFGLHPLIYHDPKTGLQGKFCLEYVLSAALAGKQVVLDDFTDTAINRPQVRKLMALVEAKEDPACRPEDPEAKNSSAGTGGFHIVTIRTADGNDVSTKVQYPSGSPYHPLSDADIAEKFRDCLAAGDRDAAAGARLFAQLTTLQDVADIHALLADFAVRG